MASPLEKNMPEDSERSPPTHQPKGVLLMKIVDSSYVVVVVGSLHAGGEARKEASSDVHEAMTRWV